MIVVTSIKTDEFAKRCAGPYVTLLTLNDLLLGKWQAFSLCVQQVVDCCSKYQG